MSVTVRSQEIERATLHTAISPWAYLYTTPFLSLYPLLAYAYYVKYDSWLGGEEWTFLACMSLCSGHALSFLVTRWSTGAKAWVTAKKVCCYIFLFSSPTNIPQANSLQDATHIRIVPKQHRGSGEIVPIDKKDPSNPASYIFTYQRDTYTVESLSPLTFTRLPYPCTGNPPVEAFLTPKPLTEKSVPELTTLYGGNEFDIPIPSFTELFGEHATAPFFVFQVFCVGLWCLDEYWYYSLFTLFMLIMFECTVVYQVRGSCLAVTVWC